MDNAVYDTSLTIFALPEPSPALETLLATSPSRLQDHARTLQKHLSVDRAAYEHEEERLKIGGLRGSFFSLLHGEQDNAEPYGVFMRLLYDRIDYKFILYGDEVPPNNTKGKHTQKKPENQLPLLLVKASSSVNTRFLSFLETYFQSPTVIPLRLPASYLPTALNNYINELASAHETISADHALLELLKDTIGVLRLTISITDADIAKSLRTIDIDIPPETLYQLVTDVLTRDTGFLGSLQRYLHIRTGLFLPLVPTAPPQQPPSNGNDAATVVDDDDDEPPLKVSRMSSAAFALSSEGRIKLSSKAVQVVEAIPGLGSGEENVVRIANRTLLRGLIAVALTLGE